MPDSPKKPSVRRARRRNKQLVVRRKAAKPTMQKPRYDADNRTLWFRGVVVKHFVVPSPSQTLILEAFQEQHWPAWIDDPLPPRSGRDSRVRLHNAVNRLKDKQQHPLLQFHGDGTGKRVGWSVRQK